MDTKVKKALHSAVDNYASVMQIDGQNILSGLAAAFELKKPFMEKVEAMDAVFDDNQRFEELREYTFDLLMSNFFTEDVQKLEEDYLDSEEWESS